MRNEWKGRPTGRLFLLLIALCVSAMTSPATGPTLTTISDVIYRANGQPAAGTMVISWPAFSTADNKAVAAGELSVTIGAQGVVSVSLAPNEGANPTGTFYKVVYKLTDGTTVTEYWVVPSASPTTVTAIRAAVVPRQVAAQFVSRQYLDSAIASTTNGVVHRAGSETIDGSKTFAVSPVVPTPSAGVSAVNKSYVDAAVSDISTDYIHKSGDSMIGALTLANDPASPNHAATRHYVDLQVTSLNGGMAEKLSRFGDTPQALANIRYASQFAVGSSTGAQIDAACADMSGSQGMAVVPSTMADGNSTELANHCLVWDLRGRSGPNQYGSEGMAFRKGSLLRQRWTQTVTPPETFNVLQLVADPDAGGVNQSGGKANYMIVNALGTKRTKGQFSGVSAGIVNYGFGDSQSIVGVVEEWGGNANGIGDEGPVALRGAVRQGNTAFTATITSKSGNVLTFGSDTNIITMGEGRFLINKTAGVYSAGTASASGTAITGQSTLWTSLATPLTNWCFSLDSEEVTGLKYLMPVASRTSDTSLTMVNAWSNFADVNAGTYKIFKCSPVTGVNVVAKTITVSDGSLFQVGENIELPLDNRFSASGILIDLSQNIASSGLGSGGLTVRNLVGTSRSRMMNGQVWGGNFNRVFEMNGQTIAPQYGFLFNTGPSPDILIGLSDNVNNHAIRLFEILRNGGSTARLTFDKSIDAWVFGAAGGRLEVSESLKSVAINNTPQSGTTFYVDATSGGNTDNGLIVQGNTTGVVGSFDIAGVPRLRITSATLIVNNGVNVAGFSDNQSTQKWGITGSSGLAMFLGGVCYNSAKTVCDSTGSGAPTGACVTGSTYKRTDGGSATTLYICEATAWVASGGGGGGGSTNWNSIGTPTGAQSLTMAANTSTWTWNATTGSSTDLLRLTDTSGNTGTGHILSVETATTSNAKPFQVKARAAAAFEINELGVVSVLNTVATDSSLAIQAGGQLTLKGRDDWSAPVSINGSDFSGTGGVTASNVSIRGGDAAGATGSNIGGDVVIRSGGATSDTGTPGNLQIAQTYLKDTTVTSGYLQCFKAAAAMTVGNCGTSTINSVGVSISASNTNPVVVQFRGIAVLQFDATFSPSAGWFACSSASTGGKVIVQLAACASGRQVGIVAQNGTSITSGKVFLYAK